MTGRACQVWGILNVTSDSFSDGGKFFEQSAALAQAESMLAQGAAVIDVGGESTRPGAERVSEEQELARVLSVVAALASAGVRVSVDTMRSGVARAAVEHGAAIINDVSGGLADPEMHQTVAELGCSYVVMHWRGHSKTMDSLSSYGDVVGEVLDELRIQAELAVAAGVEPERLILDPGLGFSKQLEHNWTLLRHLDRFVATGYPILVGASRKRFLGAVSGADSLPEQRDAATSAVSMYAALHGAAAVRVHDVAASVAAASVAKHIREAG